MALNYRRLSEIAPNIPRGVFLPGGQKEKQRTYHTIAVLVLVNAKYADTPFSARDLERDLDIKHATSRNATLWLERAGFITRTTNPRKRWALTEQGKAVKAEAEA